ncbi:hypothetical protein PHLCEN_2v11917 [Hermanssonia centrifuga]|uniref:Uncharacterized protein n=1 Tax=Hermanssonia centrifuga TaxID=98765 RepID=A0A2R6NIM1_9APHY|nr:hypothetical protein PHLCEN_2v11917 [Hermanssonia centrifuga]
MSTEPELVPCEVRVDPEDSDILFVDYHPQTQPSQSKSSNPSLPKPLHPPPNLVRHARPSNHHNTPDVVPVYVRNSPLHPPFLQQSGWALACAPEWKIARGMSIVVYEEGSSEDKKKKKGFRGRVGPIQKLWKEFVQFKIEGEAGTEGLDLFAQYSAVSIPWHLNAFCYMFPHRLPPINFDIAPYSPPAPSNSLALPDPKGKTSRKSAEIQIESLTDSDETECSDQDYSSEEPEPLSSVYLSDSLFYRSESNPSSLACEAGSNNSEIEPVE